LNWRPHPYQWKYASFVAFCDIAKDVATLCILGFVFCIVADLCQTFCILGRQMVAICKKSILAKAVSKLDTTIQKICVDI